jgi:hypothetical protein
MQFEKVEPSVDSNDREERIRARRARIREKLDTKGIDLKGGITMNVQKKKEIERNQVLKGKAQIHDSKRLLRKLLEEGDEDVTRVSYLSSLKHDVL